MDAPEPSRAWPVPHQQVEGKRGGLLAWLECRLVLATMGAVARLPAGLRSALVGLLARAGRRFDRPHSRAAEAFLLQALGRALPREELAARVLQAWRHLLEVTLDFEVFDRRIDRANASEHLELELCAQARELIAKQQGCVLVGGHIGDWETGAALISWAGFGPLYVISKPPKNRYLARHAQRVRESRGMRLLPRRGAMEFAPAVVRGGGTLAMLLDQRARLKPVLAPFFGRESKCDRSASVLLRRLRVPLVFAACYRTANPLRYRLVVPRVVQPEEVAGKSAEEVAALVNGELEKLILAEPEQYFWLHDRWR
jgi:Kdo2-lipid IVA lauroyltransferase/acyltransferase